MKKLKKYCVLLLSIGIGTFAYTHEVDTYIDFNIGTKTIFQEVSTESLLNQDNWINDPPAYGNMFQTTVLEVYFFNFFSFFIETESTWFYWNTNTIKEIKTNDLYGSETANGFAIQSWNLSGHSPNALFTFEVGKTLFDPTPSKQLKAAHYFDWVFNGQEKTVAQASLVLNSWSFKTIYAPQYSWVPDSIKHSNQELLSSKYPATDDVYYFQGQYFYSLIDIGVFYAYDTDSTAGLWISYLTHPNFLVYGESSISTKKWMPLVQNNAVSLTQKNGIKSMVGFQYSPSFLDVSLYVEALYIGDGYAKNDWVNFNTNLEEIHKMNPQMGLPLKASILDTIRFTSMSPYNFAIHIKPNNPILDMIDWSYSLRYSLPSDLYSRLALVLNTFEFLNLQARWDHPFSIPIDSIKREHNLFLYTQELELLLYVSFYF